MPYFTMFPSKVLWGTSSRSKTAEQEVVPAGGCASQREVIRASAGKDVPSAESQKSHLGDFSLEEHKAFEGSVFSLSGGLSLSLADTYQKLRFSKSLLCPARNIDLMFSYRLPSPFFRTSL